MRQRTEKTCGPSSGTLLLANMASRQSRTPGMHDRPPAKWELWQTGMASPSQEASLSKQQSATQRGRLGIPVMYDDDAHALKRHLLHRSMTELVRWLEGGLKQHTRSIYELLLAEFAEQSANVGEREVHSNLMSEQRSVTGTLLERYFWAPVDPHHGTSVVGMVDVQGGILLGTPTEHWHVATTWARLICGFIAAADLFIYEATWVDLVEVICSKNPHWKLIIIIIII